MLSLIMLGASAKDINLATKMNDLVFRLAEYQMSKKTLERKLSEEKVFSRKY